MIAQTGHDLLAVTIFHEALVGKLFDRDSLDRAVLEAIHWDRKRQAEALRDRVIGAIGNPDLPDPVAMLMARFENALLQVAQQLEDGTIGIVEWTPELDPQEPSGD